MLTWLCNIADSTAFYCLNYEIVQHNNYALAGSMQFVFWLELLNVVVCPISPHTNFNFADSKYFIVPRRSDESYYRNIELVGVVVRVLVH